MKRQTLLTAVIKNPFPLVHFLFFRSPSKIPRNKVYRFLPTNPTIIEAGVGDGDDTVKFARRYPSGLIFGLEPIETLYRDAKDKTKDFENVKIYCEALSKDKKAFVNMYTFEKTTHHSSSVLQPTEHLENFPNVKFGKSIKVPSQTLEDFMSREKINEVDLLWLDLQGYEVEVLKGSEKSLEKIKVVHMETSRIAMYDKAPTHIEVCLWMKKQGFETRIVRSPWIFGNVLFLNSKYFGPRPEE